MNSNTRAVSLAIRLLLRLFNQHPSLAPDSIRNVFMPCLSSKLASSGSIGAPLVRFIPDLVALAPTVAVDLLHMCAEHVLLGGANELTYLLIDMIEQSMSRLILDGFDEASIEHAASIVTSRMDNNNNNQTVSSDDAFVNNNVGVDLDRQPN